MPSLYGMNGGASPPRNDGAPCSGPSDPDVPSSRPSPPVRTGFHHWRSGGIPPAVAGDLRSRADQRADTPAFRTVTMRIECANGAIHCEPSEISIRTEAETGNAEHRADRSVGQPGRVETNSVLPTVLLHRHPVRVAPRAVPRWPRGAACIPANQPWISNDDSRKT